MIPRPISEPDELRPRQAAEAAGERLRQPLHQQQADPAEEPDGREQDLVRPPAGEHEGDVDREQRAEVGRQEAGLGRRRGG